MKNETLILLNNLISNGTISSGIPLKQAEEIMNKYLKMHTHKIWVNEEKGTVVTYVYTKGGKKQISAKTELKLNEKLIKFYMGIESSPTVKEIFELWLDNKLETEIKFSRATYDRYKTDFPRFFDREFAAIKVRDLNEDYLHDYVKKVIKSQNLTYKAYSGMRTLLNGILKYAKSKHLTDISARNFFDELSLTAKSFIKRQEIDENQIYPVEDRQKLIEYVEKDCEHEDVALAVLFDFRTGVRIGELGAAKKSDIMDDVIFVQRQLACYKDPASLPGERKRIHETLPYTKTEAGLRNVILTDNAKRTVKKACALHPESEYLFIHNGKQITSNMINTYLRKACKAVGIKYRSVHKIRKTFATMLLDGGVDDAYVKRIMGHENISTTHNHYYYCDKQKKDYEAQIKRAIVI